MNGLRTAALAAVLFLAATTASAGVILNTLQNFGEDDPGWSGGVTGAFRASGGNTDRMGLELGGRMLWRGEHDLWRLQGAAEREETNGQESARSIVGHLRQNHHLGGPIHSVAFVQIQHNPFQRLQSRWLVGAGARWDLKHDESGAVSIGATHMVEVERINDEPDHETDQRLSAFLRTGRALNESVSLDVVTFIQPLWSDFSDRRAMGNATLTISLTGSLSLRIGGGVDYDSRPPAGVDTTDWRTSTGLGMKF